MISGKTRVLALLGRPVKHSLSPAMHNAAFRALGLDAVYLALDCAPDTVGPLMRALADAGGGGNVTIPYKTVAAEVFPSGDDGPMGACNTFWSEGGVLRGANTDPDGVLYALDRLEVDPRRWLIVGTGGSARGCLEAARRRDAAVAVRSRHPDRAAAFLDRARAHGLVVVAPEECELILNATPLGLAPSDPPPVTLAEAPSARAVLDLVYAPGGTPLVRAARAAGLPAADGREVLVGQGAASFGKWFPATDPPIEIMRAALRAGLG